MMENALTSHSALRAYALKLTLAIDVNLRKDGERQRN